MKNLNSISNVKAAIEYEIERQTGVLEEGVVASRRRPAVGMSRATVAFRYEVRKRRTTTAISPIQISCPFR
jgi:Asp-tRNA(Asn)/Glu-tRNA(Gln) amidotransferase B subunit